MVNHGMCRMQCRVHQPCVRHDLAAPWAHGALVLAAAAEAEAVVGSETGPPSGIENHVPFALPSGHLTSKVCPSSMFHHFIHVKFLCLEFGQPGSAHIAAVHVIQELSLAIWADGHFNE